jgi:tRNA dimethylallyltransferase
LANHFLRLFPVSQFFKEMTIGTAVPTTANWPLHHFIQNKSIFENYTVGEFEKEAVKK